MFEWKQELSKEIFTKKYLINQGDIDIDQVFKSVSEEIASVEKTKEKQEYWKDVFYKELINKRFIPAGRIIANARPYSKVKNYNNCFAIEIKDSMEGIFSALKDDALIQKQGGGVGFSLSHLRPKGAAINAGGESSGPLSFLRIFNESAKSIHTGGGRRGAHIATLDISHPDIEEFITCKHGDKNKEFTQFNLSVCITDKFINAVKQDLDWNLEFEGKIYKTVKAKYLYELMTKNAFIYAEPGILCVDTINKESNVSYIGSCEQTNPCGEVPLLPYESCNLGSLKLSTFVLNPFKKHANIDWSQLEKSIEVAIKFLDNNLDASAYPLKRIEHTVKSLRRIGLGFTAYADMLIKLGLSYGSKEALQFTNKLGAFIRDTAYRYSIQLAKEKGSFEKFDADKYLKSEFCKRLPEDIRHAIKKYGIRNSSLLSVAPTGTISLSVGQNCSSGIEPVFSFEQKRKIRTGNGDETTEQITYSEVFLDFKNYFEGKYNSKDVEIPSYFKTTANITPKEHIDTQSVWQKYIDNSISKTINIPKEFTYEQYKDLFLYAYDAGCKGITSFWEGGALSPVLSDAKKDSQVNSNVQQCTEITEHCAPKRPQDLPCEIHQIVVDHKPVLVLVGKLKDKIYEVFFDYNFTENGDKKIDVMKAKEGIIRKVRSNIYSLLIKTDEGKELIIIDNIANTFDDLAGMIARFVSLGLRYGTPLQIILNQLQKTKNFNSFTKIVARVLKKYIKNGEKVKTSDNRCPECSTELIFQDGCIICPNCGFSKCS